MRQLIFIALILPLLSVLITSCSDAQHPFPTTDQEGLRAELQALIDEQVEDKNIFGTVVKVESTDGSFSWTGAAGDLEVETPYFIASVTKLYTTAVVLKLVDQGLISLDDRLDQYLGTDILDGLHVYRGTDHAPEITVRQLLGHTSGLPDYFQHKQDGETLEERISHSQDLAWSRAEVWTWAKEMKPEFEPGKPGKAHYSDTNFQLLGEIVEQVSGMSIAEAYEQYIFQPLGLEHTYLYTDPTDNTPKPIYFKEEATSIPMAMASFGADGAIVSTVDEGHTFLSNARKITSSFCAEISFADKEEKPSLAGQMRLFLTQYAGERSSQKRNLFFERYLGHFFRESCSQRHTWMRFNRNGTRSSSRSSMALGYPASSLAQP